MVTQFRAIVVSLSVLFAVCIPHSVAAEVIDSFHADIELLQENSAIITETIQYDFSGSTDERHGIYRDIPRQYTETTACADGEVGVIVATTCTREVMHPITVVSVTNSDGVAQPYTLTDSSAEWLRIKIGDPDVTVSGTQSYVIRYIFSAPVSHDTDQNTAQFFWNVTGNDWKVNIEEASATVRFSGMSLQSVDCFSGYSGSTDSDCFLQETEGVVTVQANQELYTNEGLSIKIVFQGENLPAPAHLLKASVKMPDCFFGYCITSEPLLQLRSSVTDDTSAPWEVSLINAVGEPLRIALPGSVLYTGTVTAFLHDTIEFSVDFSETATVDSDLVLYKNSFGKLMNFAFPLVATVIYLTASAWFWYRHGRDPRVSSVVVTEFAPPKNLSPIEMGVIVDGDAKNTQIIAQVIQLAVRGYIVIEQRDQEGLTRFIKPGEHEYEYRAVKEKIIADWDDPALSTIDRLLLTAFFGEKCNTRESVDMVELKKTFHSTVPQIHNAAIQSVVDKGFFTRSPRTLKYAAMAIAVVWIIGNGAVFFFLDSVFALVLGVPAGIIGAIFGAFMSQQTVAGAEMRRYIQGYKKYLSVAEKDRIAFFNNPAEYQKIFETVLPYAMILGVEKQWSAQFVDILTEPPSWYHGNFTTGFLIGSFMSDMDSMTDVMTASSTVSSSGGSGGGFGGGGGGSW